MPQTIRMSHLPQHCITTQKDYLLDRVKWTAHSISKREAASMEPLVATIILRGLVCDHAKILWFLEPLTYYFYP
jgi:hypothetical protein